MSKLRIGVVGAGSISELHLKSYQNNPDVELYAICDLNSQRCEETAKQYGIPHTFMDFRQMFADTQIDAISICTWNNSHAVISIAALEAGKHVLCEKPLSKTLEEALKVEEAVRRTGKLLQVGFVRRYATNTQILRTLIDAGELGEIYYAKASYIRRLGNPGGWFSDIERSGGGPLVDLGVHVIDLCWYLMGRPKVKSVSGNTYTKLGNRSNIKNLSFYQASDYDASQNSVEDLANAIIRFENGASIMVEASFTLHAIEDEVAVKLYGDKGGAEIEPEFRIATEKQDTILNITPQVNNKGLDVIEAFQKEINHFVNSCLGRTDTLSPVEDGVELMKILCGIYESAREGVEIRF